MYEFLLILQGVRGSEICVHFFDLFFVGNLANFVEGEKCLFFSQI
jgi:hypothetical protein